MIPNHPISLSGFGSPLRKFILPNFEDIGKRGAVYCRPYKNIQKTPRVKALLFQGENPLGEQGFYLILNYDFISIPIDFSLKILKNLTQNFPDLNLNLSNVQFVATHTHSGPAGLTENQFWGILVCDRFNPDLFELVQHQTLAAVFDAVTKLETLSKLDVAQDQVTGFNFSRFNNMDVDTDIYFANFKNSSLNSMGCIQIFSAHPTWYGFHDLTYSSDLPGYIEENLQKKINANTCLYFNGTVGNATTNLPEKKELFSEHFTTQVLLKTQINTSPPQKLNYGNTFLKLPKFQLNYTGCDLRLNTHFSDHVIKNIFDVKDSQITNNVTKIAWFSLDDTYFFLFPGEPLFDTKTILQNKIRAQFPDIKFIYMISTANDYIGYLMSPKNYYEKSMETCSTLHGPHAAEVLVEGFLESLKHFKKP
jgi:hypothetical protein